MKILIICQYYYPESFVVTKIAEELARRGHDVSVLTGKPNYGFGYILPGYQNISYELLNGVKVHRVNVKPRKGNVLSLGCNYLSFWISSKHWVKGCKEKFDVVYSYSLSPVTILSAGNLYAKLNNVKHVAHIVDIWPDSVVATGHTHKFTPLYFFLKVWSKYIYNHVNTLLIGTPSYEEYFKKVLHLKNKNVIYVPQPSQATLDCDDPYQYKQKFNILYCGNISKLQLINYLAPSLQKLPNSDIHIHVIGNGNYAAQLVKDINDYNVKDRITFYGSLPACDVNNFYANADACLVSLSSVGYVGKTIPNKLINAMMFSKPVLALLDGDGKDILVKCDGAVFSKENIDDFVYAMSHIASFPKSKLDQMGKNNHAYYKDHFTLSMIIDNIENILVK